MLKFLLPLKIKKNFAVYFWAVYISKYLRYNYISENLNDNQFKITKQFYKNGEQFQLMKKKGIYSYKYIDSFKKYDKTNLLSKEKFYDQLNYKHCSDEDYFYTKL